MKEKIIVLVLIWFTTNSHAQLHEFGTTLGGSNYVGDIGSSMLIRPNAPAVGLIYKYNRNPRISYRISYTSMKIIANNSESKNEVMQQFDTPLNKTIRELTAGIDFNFSEYQISHWKKAHTPYLIFELAAFYYKKAEGTAENYSYKSQLGIAIPFGTGYKAQIFNNIILGFEVRIRYTFTDDLDDSLFYKNEILKDHPENAKFGDPNTNDWYAFTGFTITYTFGKPLYYSTKRR
ncbi:DUF6089 family protein [Flavicella sp.]|uniref:type IX secretion system protein PorG n=1 Tax=Flavicella sp. TaxID=2957742 RepID=UPI003016C401